MEMAGKKQNDSLIVQNNDVESKKNTFDGGIQYLSLDQLVDFKNHPFKVEMNTELFELMQSIEKEGILVPLLARPNPAGEGYELIAGHRKKAAGKWAGVDKVPVMVVELDDNQAVIAMVDMVDEGRIAFTVAVELSYLNEEEQYELHAVMDMEQ